MGDSRWHDLDQSEDGLYLGFVDRLIDLAYEPAFLFSQLEYIFNRSGSIVGNNE
jgi:hypothetical protein